MDFSKYKTYILVNGFPHVSITKNGMTISKTAVVKMEQPSFISIAINPEEKMIALFSCDDDAEGAIAFVKEKDKKRAKSIRINNRDLINTICKLMGWEYENCAYRVIGEWYEEENAFVIDLKSAEELSGRENDLDDE